MCKNLYFICVFFLYDWGASPFWSKYDLDTFFQHWLWTQRILGCFGIYVPLCIFQPHYFFVRYPSGKEPENHFFFSSPGILKLALKRWNDPQWLPRGIRETEKIHDGFLMHKFLSIYSQPTWMSEPTGGRMQEPELCTHLTRQLLGLTPLFSHGALPIAQ